MDAMPSQTNPCKVLIACATTTAPLSLLVSASKTAQTVTVTILAPSRACPSLVSTVLQLSDLAVAY